MFPHKYRPFVLTNIFQHSFLDAGRHLWAHSLAALDGLQFLHPILPDFDDGAAMTRSWQFDAVPHPSCGLMQGQLLVYTILKVPPRSGFVLASVSDSSSAFWGADLCGKAFSLSARYHIFSRIYLPTSLWSWSCLQRIKQKWRITIWFSFSAKFSCFIVVPYCILSLHMILHISYNITYSTYCRIRQHSKRTWFRAAFLFLKFSSLSPPMGLFSNFDTAMVGLVERGPVSQDRQPASFYILDQHCVFQSSISRVFRSYSCARLIGRRISHVFWTFA